MFFTEKVARCGTPGEGPYASFPGGNVWAGRPIAIENGRVVGSYYTPVLPGPKNDYAIDPATGLLPQFAIRPEACDPFRASTVHGRKICVAFADGSVRFFNRKIGTPTAVGAAPPGEYASSPSVWITLLTPAGDDKADLSAY